MRSLSPLALLVLLIALGAGAPASAQTLEDGLAAYRKRDWTAAAQILRPLADSGVAIAQERLGRLYQRGKGVDRDYAQALVWYRKAASQDEPSAEGHLGVMYLEGLGVPKSNDEAVRWFHLAAAQGNPIAQTGLGRMQLQGLGKEAPDPEMAANWFREAAYQGDAAAMLGLGRLYEQGRGVTKSYVQAWKWYTLAAVDDGENSQAVFDIAAQCRDDVEMKLSRVEIDAAKQLVRAWQANAGSRMTARR